MYHTYISQCNHFVCKCFKYNISNRASKKLSDVTGHVVEHYISCLSFSAPDIYLQALSESFSGDIPEEHMTGNSFFPDEYFTCSSVCLSCGYVSLSIHDLVTTA